ncbi:MAG TPA: methionine ABC transporter permease [Spirochaetota bacterium]|nr:methionine ABC transporter permease [Spirochaetota bacterium]HPS86153.1 methionine ABC transporter permease [Spirochaetota bacterium]
MDNLAVLVPDLTKAFIETFQMVGISLACAALFGIPLGLFIFTTDRGLFFENRVVNSVSGFAVNIIRSVPFVILLVLLLPFTQIMTGTTIGPVAASIPLSVAAVAFYARLVEASLREIDRGVIEASNSMGASPLQIIRYVLLPESMPGLLRGLTVTAINLVGYSAMAGIVGGGGVGDLAIRFGYYRYQTDVMITTVIALIILVQGVQSAGDYAAKKKDHA